ncbi:hypothetical protein EW146_g4420 [Bondarzewia mesenterica]|uniref:Decapping nuclease n=1 Tax=Bondarzewia mesenterica TaxID=1095465 RepID=A0A4S4LV51_9AGAM|nr:hypothetical protein EW146_g4420 [Bondarzewia mesenterica]
MCAVDSTGIRVDWTSVDFVTDCGLLRRLYQWVNSSSTSKEFRLDLQLVGQRTILLACSHGDGKRRSASTDEIHSFGRNFERATTSAPVGGNRDDNYIRILRYNLGGLNMIVQSEVDACLQSLPGQNKTIKMPSENSKGVDTGAVSSSKPIPGGKLHKQPDYLPVRVIPGGTRLSQDNLVELKTTVSSRSSSDVKSKAWPQLFFSQSAHLITGVHKDGFFSKIRHDRVTHDVSSRSGRIRGLVSALRLIQETAVSRGTKGLELGLIFQSARLLCIYRREGGGLLPKAMIERIWRR